MLKKRIFLFIVLSVFFGIFCYGQNHNQNNEIKRITGTLEEVDWVGNKISVRTMHFGKIDEITLIVSSDTEIIKGTDKVGFLEVKVSDEVAVEYVDNSLSGLKALSIMVMKR
ncbi:MAG: hypothetical protein WCI77_08825 [Candidatus Omnitrophota bacterium]